MIRSGQLTVTSTPVQIDGVSVDPMRMHVHNNDNTNNLALGGPDVTASTGMLLPKLDSIELIINPGESLWAVSTNGSILISWMVQTY